MSERFPGGIISVTPPTLNPALGNAAPGIWTLDQVTQAIRAGTWPSYDPYYKYVTLNLHGNGTNGAQNNTFLDSSTNNFTITRNGNVTQGTFTPYGSNWSNYFDGTGDYITSSQSQTIPATGDFTIDGWFWCNTYTNYPSILSQGTSGNAGRFNIYINNDGKFGVQIGATSSNIGSAVPTNQWVHFAVTRSGSTVTVYINGASIGTATNGTSIQNTTPSIGSEWTGDPYRWIGYLSNIRVSDVVRTISLPSSPFVADANTVLLACQSNRFIDTSTTAATLTPNGNVSVQRFSPFNPGIPWGTSTIGGSGYFDGSGDYLTVPNNTALQMGSGDFTIEFWINFNSISGFQTPIDKGYTGAGAFLFQTGNGNGRMVVYASGSAVITESGTAPTGAWIHYALVRSGTTLTLYRDGVSSGSATNSTNFNDTNQVGIGANGTGAVGTSIGQFPINGYLSNVRIVKGTAVYTAAFTPPSAPLTAITNTSLLLNYTNGGIFDNAMMNDLETVGNAQISTSVVKYGTGSIYLDGSGDWLAGPPTPQTDLGSGDFTIEAWLYRTASGAASDSGMVSRGAPSTLNGFVFAYTSANVLTFNFNYSGAIVTGATAISINTWTHVAVSRNGNTFRLFVNGVVDATATSTNSQTTNASDVFYVGRSGFDSGRIVTGYLDDVRLTKGYARYTANFTPPTSQLQDQ